MMMTVERAIAVVDTFAKKIGFDDETLYSGVSAVSEAIWAYKDGHLTEEDAVDVGYTEAAVSMKEIDKLFENEYDEYFSKELCKAIDLAYELLENRIR